MNAPTMQTECSPMNEDNNLPDDASAVLVVTEVHDPRLTEVTRPASQLLEAFDDGGGRP